MNNHKVLNPLLNNKPISKKILVEHAKTLKIIDSNKKKYKEELKELRFLVNTKQANEFTQSMYIAIISGRKITPKMHNAIQNIVKYYSHAELEKRRLETERLIGKTRLIREVFSKCNYHETYVWRTEEFLDSIDEQINKYGNLTPKQKLALNNMYKRFKKKSEKRT